MQDDINFACSEEFAELCALSTSGCLSIDEEDRLEAHVARCAECALLLNQYRTLASAGMATIAARRTKDEPSEGKLQNASQLKEKLLSALGPPQTQHAADAVSKGGSIPRLVSKFRIVRVVGIAATIAFAVTAGYLIGGSNRAQRARSIIAASADAKAALEQQLAIVRSELTIKQRNLDATLQAASNFRTESAEAQKRLSELQNEKTVLEAKIEALATDSQKQSVALAALTMQRDTAIQKLSKSESLLQSAQQRIGADRDERENLLLRNASLGSQVKAISAQMQEQEATTRRDKQYLAEDRDIRDLMSARQLYIADVFDVDSRGKTRKPFGRVFYTKGKSLIFYAFDLDQQPGYKEARAFQVWGRQDSGRGTPVSLGIFYLDSEQNRRWALKYNDPKVLDEINALFVTVEPKGGSKRPTNKPFLLAYLHATAPNHP